MKSAELELLKDARKLIRKKDRWLQHSLAVDANGRCVWPTDPHACRRCLQGAMRAAIGYSEHHTPLVPNVLSLAEMRLNRILNEQGERENYVRWQDDDKRQHGEVLQLIDDAIAELEMATIHPLPDLPKAHRQSA
jgi:hypothetical protein